MSRESDRMNVTFNLCSEKDLSNIKTILEELKLLGENIMSKISEFAVKQQEYNDKMDLAVEGLKGDIQSLNDEILKLQNSAGEITPEDQASLDALQGKGQELSDKLTELDNLTQPVPPVGV